MVGREAQVGDELHLMGLGAEGAGDEAVGRADFVEEEGEIDYVYEACAFWVEFCPFIAEFWDFVVVEEQILFLVYVREALEDNCYEQVQEYEGHE